MHRDESSLGGRRSIARGERPHQAREALERSGGDRLRDPRALAFVAGTAPAGRAAPGKHGADCGRHGARRSTAHLGRGAASRGRLGRRPCRLRAAHRARDRAAPVLAPRVRARELRASDLRTRAPPHLSLSPHERRRRGARLAPRADRGGRPERRGRRGSARSTRSPGRAGARAVRVHLRR